MSSDQNSIRFSIIGASCLSLLVSTVYDAGARQTVISGDISGRYEYQERNYDNDLEYTDDGDVIIVVEDLRGDERNYILAPRITFSSRGVSDLYEFTVAPAVNYDDIYGETDIDWDLRLRGQRNLSKKWNVLLTDRFYQGDDPIRDSELQTAVISSETEEPAGDPEVGAPADDEDASLTERYGRYRYWRNNLALSTEYTYADRSTIDGGYAFAVLRNEENDIRTYTDYDRHEGFLTLSHRFGPKWRGELEGEYIVGIFEDSEVIIIDPDDEEDDNVLELDSDDLQEYNFRGRVNYNYDTHLHYFTEIRSLNTDFESDLREDYNINELSVGLNYNLSPHLRVTLYGGPVVGSFDNSPTDTDFTAYGGLSWDFQHAVFSLMAEKGYNQSNFDGRRSGLTGFWGSRASLDYQMTKDLQGVLSASYWNYDRMQYTTSSVVIVDPTQPEFGQTLYTETSYSAGAYLNYTFMERYQLSGGYRYYDHDSDLIGDTGGNYDEHRVFVQLSYAKELFRW